jgi:autotransporter-associated beta strand protein
MSQKCVVARRFRVAVLAAAALAAGLPQVLTAGTHTWTGATNGLWSVASNWSEGTAPAAGESNVVLVFPQSAANLANTNDISGLTVDSISVTTGASSPLYVMTGNSITLKTSLTFDNPGSGSYHPDWGIPVSLGGSVTITCSGRQSIISDQIGLNAQALTLTTQNGDIFVSGSVVGSGSITKNGNGALILAGTNTYSGPTTATAGALYIEGGSALGDSGTGTTIQAGAHLGLSGGPFTCPEPISFAGGGIYAYGQNILSGTIVLNADVSISTSDPLDRLTISGAVSGSGGLVKSQPGALVLSGSGSYLGITEIDSGEVSVTGSITSDVSLSGSSAKLSGNGSVGSITYAAAGAVVYPEVDGTPAVLTANGGLTGLAGGILQAGLAQGHASRLAVNGLVDLDSTMLVLDRIGGYSPPFGRVFKLIQNDGSDSVTGTFSGQPEGNLLKIFGQEFDVSYVGGTGNDVTIQVPLLRHAVGDIDKDGADEAAVDFGTLGIWLYNGGAWTQLSPVNPESLIAADVDGDGDAEFVADLGALGLWLWDGGAWSILSSKNPEGLATADVDGDGIAELIADFDSVGLWLWNGGAWNILSSADAEFVIPGDVDADLKAEVIAGFGSLGLWIYNDGAWSALSSADADSAAASDLDADTFEEVIVDFGSLGLWVWDSGTWTERSAADADYVVAGPVLGSFYREVVADFGTAGFWLLDGSTWSQLSSSNADFLVTADVGGAGHDDVLADFGSLGLWEWNGSSWNALSSANADFLTAGDFDGDGTKELLADFGALGLWLDNGGVWSQVSGQDAQ